MCPGVQVKPDNFLHASERVCERVYVLFSKVPGHPDTSLESLTAVGRAVSSPIVFAWTPPGPEVVLPGHARLLAKVESSRWRAGWVLRHHGTFTPPRRDGPCGDGAGCGRKSTRASTGGFVGSNRCGGYFYLPASAHRASSFFSSAGSPMIFSIMASSPFFFGAFPNGLRPASCRRRSSRS